MMKNFTDFEEMSELSYAPLEISFYEKIMNALRTRVDDVRIALVYFGAATTIFGLLCAVYQKIHLAYQFVALHWIMH